MKLEFLDAVHSTLNQLESAGSYDMREIEACMEALATQITFLTEHDDDPPDSLSDAIFFLPIAQESKDDLVEMCEEMKEIIQRRDYDSGDDDDDEDFISDLIGNFYTTLKNELKKIEPAE
jgi:hypothetical protein